jgi:5-methylcytosine-specific restriction endonuclease McrA
LQSDARLAVNVADRRKGEMTTRTARRRRAQLAQRDGWLCALCGEVIDPARARPDQWAPTLHHVRPLARGGRNALANLQLVHDVCHREHHRPKIDQEEAA